MTELKDVITWDAQHRVHWPTLCGCAQCGGYTAIYHKGQTIHDPALALEVAKFQHGYYIAKWEGQNVGNRDLFPQRVCTCAAELDRARAAWAATGIAIMSDTGWVLASSSIVRRGIRDYERAIEFSRELTSEERGVFVTLAKLDQCPGYIGPGMKKTGLARYELTTTWDSSD